MKEVVFSAWDVLLRFTGAAGAAAGGGSVPVLFALMALNLICVSFEMAKKGEWKLLAFFHAILKKGLVIGIILLAGWMDGVSGKGSFLQNAAIGFYTCDEGLALLKSAARLGIPIPVILRKAANDLLRAE